MAEDYFRALPCPHPEGKPKTVAQCMAIKRCACIAGVICGYEPTPYPIEEGVG